MGQDIALSSVKDQQLSNCQDKNMFLSSFVFALIPRFANLPNVNGFLSFDWAVLSGGYTIYDLVPGEINSFNIGAGEWNVTWNGVSPRWNMVTSDPSTGYTITLSMTGLTVKGFWTCSFNVGAYNQSDSGFYVSELNNSIVYGCMTTNEIVSGAGPTLICKPHDSTHSFNVPGDGTAGWLYSDATHIVIWWIGKTLAELPAVNFNPSTLGLLMVPTTQVSN